MNFIGKTKHIWRKFQMSPLLGNPLTTSVIESQKSLHLPHFLSWKRRRRRGRRRRQQILTVDYLPPYQISTPIHLSNTSTILTVIRLEHPFQIKMPYHHIRSTSPTLINSTNIYALELDWKTAQWVKAWDPGSTASSKLLSIPGVCISLSSDSES